MLTNTLQHIDEIVIRIDVMQSACHQQALHDANMLRAKFGPTEQPISATHRNHPQGAFQMVGIDRHIRVVQIDLESRPPLANVGQRRDEGLLGKKPNAANCLSIQAKK